MRSSCVLLLESMASIFVAAITLDLRVFCTLIMSSSVST